MDRYCKKEVDTIKMDFIEDSKAGATEDGKAGLEEEEKENELAMYFTKDDEVSLEKDAKLGVINCIYEDMDEYKPMFTSEVDLKSLGRSVLKLGHHVYKDKKVGQAGGGILSSGLDC